MKYGLFSGILWGLDTVVLGIALSMSPVSYTHLKVLAAKAHLSRQ